MKGNTKQNNDQGLLDVEHKIYKALQDLADTYHAEQKSKAPNRLRGNKQITAAIFEAIGAIGQDDYVVRSTQHGGEWLFDMAWYQTDDKGNLQNFYLALESELSANHCAGLKDDFDRLLTTNAPYRIFICFAEPHDRHPENVNGRVLLFNELIEACKSFPVGGRILALIWDDWQTGEIHPHLMIKEL